MVVTDMDGTLLNSNHEVSSDFFKLFEDLKKHNILFVAASGRPFYSMSKKLQPILKDITIVAENGGLIIENDKLLLSTAIDNKKLNNLYTLADSIENAFPIFCTKEMAYILRTSDALIKLFSEFYNNYTVIDSLEEVKSDVIKIALYNETNSEAHIYPHVKHLENDFNVVVSGNHWVDISETITNKGYAIDFLQKHYNINPSETMAFGDYNNDFEMLQRASFSYAMANAHDNIKSIANFQTKSNDDFGVEYILKQLINNKVLASKSSNNQTS